MKRIFLSLVILSGLACGLAYGGMRTDSITVPTGVEKLTISSSTYVIGWVSSTKGYYGPGDNLTNVDAATFDTHNSSYYAQVDATQTFTGENTFSNVGNTYYGDGSNLHGIEGSAIVLYLSDTASDIAGRYVISSISTKETTSTFTVIGVSDGDTIISSFTTLSGVPGITLFVDGIHSFHFHAKKTGTKDVTIKAKVYKRTIGGTETLLYILEDSNNLTNSTAGYTIHHTESAIEVSTSTRITLQIICTVSGSGVSPDIDIYAEGNRVTRLELPSLTPTVETFLAKTAKAADSYKLGGTVAADYATDTELSNSTNTLMSISSMTANYVSTGVVTIIAGANIAISPTDGRGDVTITASAGGLTYSTNTYTFYIGDGYVSSTNWPFFDNTYKVFTATATLLKFRAYAATPGSVGQTTYDLVYSSSTGPVRNWESVITSTIPWIPKDKITGNWFVPDKTMLGIDFSLAVRILSVPGSGTTPDLSFQYVVEEKIDE